MDKKTFCPFANGECRKDCMFFTHSSADYPDNTYRTCLIAGGLNKISDRSEELLDNILTEIKSHS